MLGSKPRLPSIISKLYFLFGDSHSRGFGEDRTSDVQYEVSNSIGNWLITPIGGATAHGLPNEHSSTGAGVKIINALDKHSSSQKTIIMMFGDVDCVNHCSKANDVAEFAFSSTSRMFEFVERLRSRPDVSRVLICSPFPHVDGFSIDGATCEKIELAKRYWITFASADIDLFTPLKCGGQFLPDNLCHTPGSKDERHLSKEGYNIVWQQIKLQLLKIL